jgi:hypothetical protein
MGFSSIGLSCQTNNFNTVDVAEFAKAVADTSYIVLDVRTPAEHRRAISLALISISMFWMITIRKQL